MHVRGQAHRGAGRDRQGARPAPRQYRAELTEDALAHLRTTLCQAYHQDLPAGLQPTLVTTYRRTTFVSRTGEARLTCDSGCAAST